MRILLLSVALASGLTAAEWPQFRGPNASGVAPVTGLPVEFGPESNLVWKTELPRGASSPVFAGDRIYLTGAEGQQRITFALDRGTGRLLWRRAIAAPRAEALHKLNDPASSSPATDGVNAYVFFGDYGLASYSPEGELRWSLPLGPFTNLHGMGASPVLAGNRLFMVCDQDVGSFLLALDRIPARRCGSRIAPRWSTASPRRWFTGRPRDRPS